MAEDRRAVLAAEVEALAVAGGGIVDPPERLEQLPVADLGRVKPHLDRLGGADVVRDMAAGVAHRSLQHPMDLAEGRLHTPKASRRECGALGTVRSFSLEPRRVGVAVPELNHVMTPSSSCDNTKPAPGIPDGTSMTFPRKRAADRAGPWGKLISEAEELASLPMQFGIVDISERDATTSWRTMFRVQVPDTPEYEGPGEVEKVP